MATMRLGERLISGRIITEEQLGKALHAQLIYGGHLGTCLIELGYVDEDTLGDTLAEILGVRYAQRQLLDTIAPRVIATLNSAVVEKHRAIPFDLSHKTLRVAMVNPRNLQSLDELSFVSGCQIDPWVSPEVRIFQAMERYYEVSRRVRYITIARHLDEKKMARETARGTAGAIQQAAVAVATQGAAPAPVEAASPGGAVRPPQPVDRLARAGEEICRAEDGAQLAAVVLAQASHGAAACVLFSVRGDEASFWDAVGLEAGPAALRGLRFAVTSEPLLDLLYGEPFYRGPVPDEPRYMGFFERLRIPRPAEALLVPVHRDDRIVALFYADGGTNGGIRAETEELLALMRKLCLGLELVALKRKIKSA